MSSSGAFVGPYEILGPLGHGGMGEVFKARDTRLGREVALKFLDDQGDEAAERFAREARAASALNHPNIVTIHDIGESDGRRFIAMEFIKGQTLRPLMETQETLTRFGDIGLQVARALAAAHLAGIVHRDIKPENIMVREDGYVKVVDFGVARLIESSAGDTGETMASTAPNALIGTPRYMSPEQARAGEVTTASDIFSFGVIAYEWATGRHPFAGVAMIDVLHAIAQVDPPAPARINPEMSRSLDTLILELLQKDSARRPTASELVLRIAQLSDVAVTAVAVSTDTPVDAARVGRVREAAELVAAFESVTRGGGLLIGVSGEPGIGKTTLIEDVFRRLPADGAPSYFARGRCSERLAGTGAYLPFLEALDSLMQGPGRETVAQLLKTVAPTWYLQLGVSSDSRGAVSLEAKATSQERLKRELLAAFEELSRLRPLVLFFDDVHWADLSTVDALGYLAARFDKLRVLVVASYRPADLQLARHAFLPLFQDLVGRRIGRELAVGFLSSEDIAAYVAIMFPNHRLPAELLKMVVEKTEGNPLFMVDLLRDLKGRGVIADAGDGWSLTQPVSEVARELPASIRGLVQRKIDALDEEDRRLLVAASVQGVQFDTAVVARALEADAGGFEERLDRLERLHDFVRLVGEQSLPDGTPSSQYRFVHVLYQNGLYDSLRPVRRASLSGGIARALVTFHPKTTAPIASELALLYETAREYQPAAGHFLIAAQRASAVFADRDAIALARRGLGLLEQLPESPERFAVEFDLQLVLGLAFTATSGYGEPEVEQAYTRARAIGGGDIKTEKHFLALQGLWRFYTTKPNFRIATELGEQLLVLGRDSTDGQLTAIAHASFGIPSGLAGRIGDAVTHLDQALSLNDMNDHARLIAMTGTDPGVRALSWSSLFLWLQGYPDQAHARRAQALTRARALRHPFTQGFTFGLSSWLLQYDRDVVAVRTQAEESLVVAMEHGLGQWIPVAHILRGWSRAMEGEAREGIEEINHSLGLFARMGAELTRPFFLALLAEAYAADEQFDAALDVVANALDVAARNHEIYWTPEMHRLRGTLLLARGGADADDQAAQCFETAITTAHGLDSRMLALRATVSLALLRQRQGRGDEACADLASAHGWFTEGLETRDLRDARTLLDQLGG